MRLTILYNFYSISRKSSILIKEIEIEYDYSIDEFIDFWTESRDKFLVGDENKFYRELYIEDLTSSKCFQLYPIYKELSNKDLALLKLVAVIKE